ncbi:hypothetical protein [Spirosoma aerolatum]|uniref:hypothetical protein n=1 Tax=Spirosoma aerolatum TaxID=1211326 RepID=UPI0009AF1DBA|nr:hypothetical protein [Spirosoma aerolatum]
MKDILAKVISYFGLDHLIVTGFAFLASVLAARFDTSALIPRFLNAASGFIVACLTGYILLERGWQQWASSGMAYLLGTLAHFLTNALLNVAKQLAIDPLSTTGKIINLIWTWKLPPRS